MPKFQSPSKPSVVGNSVSTQVLNTLDTPSAVPAPAAFIGTSISGPAFVPFDIASDSDFESVFGTLEEAVEQQKNGMLAANRYFINGGGSIVYFRTLGAGDCKARLTTGNNPGSVNNAGFVVGQEIINTGTNLVGPNTYAGSTATNPGVLGRAYFLVAFMSESAGSTYLSDAGIQTVGQNTAAPIIRGMLFAPSGVVLSLSSNLEPNNTPTSIAAYDTFGNSGDGGCNIGSMVSSFGTSTFQMLLNGHVSTDAYPSSIYCSMNPVATYQDLIESSLITEFDLPVNKSLGDSLYFADVFNTDPTKIQEAGHYLHLHYDVYSDLAVVTGSGLTDNTVNFNEREPVVLLLTSSAARNTAVDGTVEYVGIPNFENYQNRFAKAFSPFVVSQKINGKRFDLFKLHAFSDGKLKEDLKFIISNIVPDSTPAGWAKFNLDVFAASASEHEPTLPLISFLDCTLDPVSENFIVNKIGDRYAYYDFDTDSNAQKTVIVGGRPLTNQFIRVEVSQELLDGNIPNFAVPIGFRGPYHLVTSGTALRTGEPVLTGTFSSDATDISGISTDTLRRVVQPPIEFRERLSEGVPGTDQLKVMPGLTWGIQYSRKDDIDNPNIRHDIGSMQNMFLYFPDFNTDFRNPWIGDNAGVADVAGCILDADRFNNNLFTLERIAVITGSSGNGKSLLAPDPSEWPAAIYVRNGKLPSALNKSDATGISDKIRFVDPNMDFKDPVSRKNLSFTVPMQGGFNGLNIFDEQSNNMTDVAVFRDRFDPNLNGPSQSTTAAYSKALDILSEKSEADMQLLSIPGIRHRVITNKAVQLSQDKFNVLFIGDVEQYDSDENYVTGSEQEPDLTNTINKFEERALGSSFGAFYFPDVLINFPETENLENLIIKTPPSVGQIGTIALNDNIAGPHTAPMGYTRGAIGNAMQSTIAFDEETDVERLIAAAINPIVDDVNVDGVICAVSQKTTLQQKTGFSRINIRRLMIEIRRTVRNIARLFLFEVAKASTARQFEAAVNSFLNGLTAANVISDYRVSIDQTSFVGSQQPISNNVQVNVGKFRPLGDLLNQQRNAETELKTIRASVFVQPIQSEEIIQLDIDESVEDL